MIEARSEGTKVYEPKALEQRVAKRWESEGMVQKVIRPRPERPKFYLLDGPPFANQIPHVGHVKVFVAKDVLAKFKLMQGYDVWLQPGFDCHGLPMEVVVEQEFGIKSKLDIEELGVERFCKACSSKAEQNSKEWLDLYKRFGVWRGWLRPYLTCNHSYIQSAWWTLERLWEKGLLVQGERPIFWCPRCQTSLAAYEVSDAYAQVKDYSLYVKFPLVGRKEYIVAWTTTPWTLVSNVALVVHPNEYYVRIKVENEVLIVAECRLDALKAECKLDFEIEEKFLGKELESVRYEPVLDVPLQQQLKSNPNAHRILLSIPVRMAERYEEFVSMEVGSGCVHCAPGHGPEDFALAQHYNLPLVSPVDGEGKFTREAGVYAGIPVKEAERVIVEQLKQSGLLLHAGYVVHSYPLCWRCKTPLIYRLSRQWFLKVDALKPLMLAEAERVQWLPAWAGEKFKRWLAEAVDWCVSRQRYWGIPLPVWVCEACGTIEVVGSVEELERRSLQRIDGIDLHRHGVDGLELECRHCKAKMKRVKDVLDVWFDSGIAAWASLDYPENAELFERWWPADLVCEAEDQIRGWFYSQLFAGVATFGTAPYRRVCMIAHVLDAKGQKMSKSLGNVVWARDALEQWGADVLRMYYCWEVPPWENQKFSFESVREVQRCLNILWNCCQFYLEYCEAGRAEHLAVEDKWMLSKLQRLVKSVTEQLERFELHLAGRQILSFVTDELSRFYIKLIRDRISPHAPVNERRATSFTLKQVLNTLSRLLAPITPFLADEVYRAVGGNLASVHLETWPEVREEWVDEEVEAQMELIKEVVEACYALRNTARIKLRWPLRRLVVATQKPEARAALQRLSNVVCRLGNVKRLEVVEGVEGITKEVSFGKVWLDSELEQDLLEEATIKELIRAVQQLRKEEGLHVKQSIELKLCAEPRLVELFRRNAELICKEVGACKLEVLSGVELGQRIELKLLERHSVGVEIIRQ